MRKSVKPLALITIFCLLVTISHAQLKLPVMNGVANDVKKVIDDYPNRFINLMGEVVTQNTQSTDYACNFKVNGAEEALVTRYSAKKEICSWKAVMLTTESFEKAKQKFRSLYNQLNNLSVSAGGTKHFQLKGKYETPDDSKKFTSVLFNMDPASESLKKLRIEIVMQFVAPMEWRVEVLVYDRERDDDERGKREEE